jgi:hypothetical protein
MSDFDHLLDTHEAELDAAANAWPTIERNVPVTPALLRRFVGRNWCFGYNGHSIYVLSGRYYAVTRKGDALVITARTAGETGQECQDLIALLSEWEG